MLHPDMCPAPVKPHIAGITRLRLNIAFAKIANAILTNAKLHAPTKIQPVSSPEMIDSVGVQLEI